MNVKKLYRSRTDRLIAGVFGGMGAYFGVDPTLLRLGWVVVTIVSAILPGIAIYVVAVIIVPLEPRVPGEPDTRGAPVGPHAPEDRSHNSTPHSASRPSASPANSDTSASASQRSW